MLHSWASQIRLVMDFRSFRYSLHTAADAAASVGQAELARRPRRAPNTWPEGGPRRAQRVSSKQKDARLKAAGAPSSITMRPGLEVGADLL
jgi:hypothetical protein